MTSPTTAAAATFDDDDDDAHTYVYHEKQESSLCGQHALNALLIGPYFTPGDLAEIAAELDAKERELMLAAGETEEALKFLAEDSGNVNARYVYLYFSSIGRRGSYFCSFKLTPPLPPSLQPSPFLHTHTTNSGFFSVDVLRLALSRFGSIELVPFNAQKNEGGKEGEEEEDLTQEQGFIVNRAEHWFALRRIGKRWWNLNSTLEEGKPEEVGRFYLSAFIGQLMMDGYSVFVVRGEGLPGRGFPDEEGGGGGGGKWFRVSELVGGNGGGKKKEETKGGDGGGKGKGEKRD